MTRNVSIEFVPLTQWPAGREHTPDHEREDAKFKAPGYYENVGQPNLGNRSVYPAPIILRDAAIAKLAYRAAAAKVHPDAGGSTTDFQLVQEAKRVLEAHHGGPL